LLGLPGWTEFATDLDTEQHPDDPFGEALIKTHAKLAVIAAVRTLSVIYALDSTVNIDLAEAETSRPERREVVRRRQKGKQGEIAATVRIKPSRERAVREVDEDDERQAREYSHAFWRRGHFAFYPLGTRMADALAEHDPAKLVDHPSKGLCRKVYRPPTVIGATGPEGEDREPVVKSYVWKDAPKREAA
jgi:hypothetical protein